MVNGQGRREVTRLKLAVVASGLQLQEVGKLAGINETSMSRYSRGVYSPRADEAARIAAVLDTTVEALWGPRETDTDQVAA